MLDTIEDFVDVGAEPPEKENKSNNYFAGKGVKPETQKSEKSKSVSKPVDETKTFINISGEIQTLGFAKRTVTWVASEAHELQKDEFNDRAFLKRIKLFREGK